MRRVSMLTNHDRRRVQKDFGVQELYPCLSHNACYNWQNFVDIIYHMRL